MLLSKRPALWSNEEVVDSKLVNLILAEDVNVFNDVVESDDDINPNSVICAEPLINTPLPKPVRYEEVVDSKLSTWVLYRGSKPCLMML